jgi:hypothetical protein
MPSGLPSGTEKWRISHFRHFHPPEISALRAVATTLRNEELEGGTSGYVPFLRLAEGAHRRWTICDQARRRSGESVSCASDDANRG